MIKRLRLLIPVLLALIVVLCMGVPTFAATTADVTITATPEYLAMTVSDGGTNTWAIGAVAESATKWYTHDNNAPSADPFEEAEMKIVITNTGSVHENFKVHGHDFTGGVGWVLSEDDSPAENEVSIRIGGTGTANEAGMTQVIHEDASPSVFHDIGETSGHIDACLELETGTFTDGVAKSGTITITCEKHT